MKTVYLTERDNFLYHGRHILAADALLLDWSSSGFSFKFKGTGFHIIFGEHKADQPVYIRVDIDREKKLFGWSGETARYCVSDGKEHVIIDDLKNEEHTVRVLRITEGEDKLYVKGIEVYGEILPPPLESVRRIEVLGDSITCGYGVRGDQDTTVFRTCDEDSTAAWAFLVAEELGADLHCQCASGKGIVRNCEGALDLTFDQMFNMTSRNGESWDHSKWTPQVVMINGGTNDGWGGVSAEEFEKGATALINDIRSKYTHAHIIWCYGLMGDPYSGLLKKLFKRMGETDDKLMFVPISVANPKKDYAAAGHPGMKINEKLADTMVSKIKSLKIWEK